MFGRSLVAAVVVGLVMAAGGVASPAALGPANGRIVLGMLGRLIVTNSDDGSKLLFGSAWKEIRVT